MVQFRSTSYIFQCINLPMETKFHVSTKICNEVIKITILEDWNLVPLTKNRTVEILRFIPTSNLFQGINLPLTTKFHVRTTNCNKFIKRNLQGAWSLVPQSKNSTRGILQSDFTSSPFGGSTLPRNQSLKFVPRLVTKL